MPDIFFAKSVNNDGLEQNWIAEAEENILKRVGDGDTRR